MKTDRREVFRYLGYGAHEADEATRHLAEECILELEDCVRPRFLVKEFPLRLAGGGRIDAGAFVTESRNLEKNLSGCEKILLMAATLGAEADRLLFRYGKLRVARAAVMQAAAAAMTEAWCNEINGIWKEQYEKEGWFLRPRFSPGYGDFSLSCQKHILDGLEAGKRIGITLTEGGLMMPSKSVTAVIGAGREPCRCVLEGCEACSRTECAFRR